MRKFVPVLKRPATAGRRASVVAARNAALQIDQDKAYTVYLLVSLFGRGVEFTTGAFVAVVIAFAWTSPEQTKAE